MSSFSTDMNGRLPLLCLSRYFILMHCDAVAVSWVDIFWCNISVGLIMIRKWYYLPVKRGRTDSFLVYLDASEVVFYDYSSAMDDLSAFFFDGSRY